MGTIYKHPESVGNPPQITQPFNSRQHDEDVSAWITRVQDWAKRTSRDEFAGEIIRFAVADGYACYVVWNLKPVKLIHLDVDDGYSFPYAHRLTAKDIKDLIKRRREFARILKG